MSHPEQMGFFRLVAAANPVAAAEGRVLEIGSYDVNGSVRALFPTSDYTGCDLTEGPGVDVVGYGHDLNHPGASFDLAISGECFEHDPHWRLTFQNMVRMTKPGGLVVFTCASRGRLEHGTTRTVSSESPGTQAEGLDYYRNLAAKDFDGYHFDAEFSEHQFWYQPWSFDLYFAGIKAGGDAGSRLPAATDVRRLRAVTSPGNKAARLPLRAASWLPERLYQPVALRYWKTVLDARQRINLPERFSGGKDVTSAGA